PAQGNREARGEVEALADRALGGFHLFGRAPGQRGMTDKVRLVLGCDDYLPDAFRSKYNPGVLLYDETGALGGHMDASDELSGLALLDRDGKPRAALTNRNGWSGCFLKDHGGTIRVGRALDAADGPRFVIQDEAERPFVSLP